MLISLNWIRDFVDLPEDLDPQALAERFTRTTAEVDGVEQIRVAPQGLIVARVERVTAIPDTANLHHVVLGVGEGKATGDGGSGSVETVTAAPGLKAGCHVVYAPAGSYVAKLGRIGTAEVAGRASSGMIVPGDALGIAPAEKEAVLVSDTIPAGEPLPVESFDDWVLEIDNKSITHRPDLWGHYGVAREMAAILGCPLKPYPVAPLAELQPDELGEFPISIAAAEACPRYSGIVVSCGLWVEKCGLRPAPLWMQLRLGHVGLRPINGLVDLTNYIMADLGQPMHAFDAAKVDRIEVAFAKAGERFQTLDDVKRSLAPEMLMIQCRGRSVALAGLMGGLDTEVSKATTEVLLESANFNPATIRSAATTLGLRTDASARFEKSLDPTNTVLAIQRFIHLAGVESARDQARGSFGDLKLMSRLSDCYPAPRAPVDVMVDLRHVARTVGREVPAEDMGRILTPLGFSIPDSALSVQQSPFILAVRIPSFRATGDVSIEADIIEEIARYVGYDNVEPAMPRVSVRRFAPHSLHQLEQRTLSYFATASAFHEIHGYVWYNAAWMRQLGVDPGPCVQLRNPAAEGLSLLRRNLMPGLLAAVVRNRFHFPAFSIMELGSVFEPGDGEDHEFRHLGLVMARRGRRLEEQLLGSLKGAIEGWAWHQFMRQVDWGLGNAEGGRRNAECGLEGRGAQHSQQENPQSAIGNRQSQALPWQDSRRTATVRIGDCGPGIADSGCVSVVDLTMRQAMDEHLESWSIAWAELRLDGLVRLPPVLSALGTIPEHPLVDLDFSLLVPKSTRYGAVVASLRSFAHPLLKNIRYLSAYEGAGVADDLRSLTFRTVIGDDARTLAEADMTAFRRDFEQHVHKCGYRIRG